MHTVHDTDGSSFKWNDLSGVLGHNEQGTIGIDSLSIWNYIGGVHHPCYDLSGGVLRMLLENGA